MWHMTGIGSLDNTSIINDCENLSELVPSILDTVVGGGGGGCGEKINLTPVVFELTQTHVARA